MSLSSSTTTSATGAPPPLGGPTKVGRVLGPSLDKIIKNLPWRKHTHLLSACKTTLDKLQTLTTALDHLSPAVSAADVILYPLLLAVDTASPKIVDAALDALFRLFSLNLLHFSLSSAADASVGGGGVGGKSVVSQLVDSLCKCASLGDEVVEFSVMKTLLAAVRSNRVWFDGEYLNHIVRTCYNVYLGGVSGTNQICAKAVLAQIVLIVFSRVEEDSMAVNRFKIVSVSELLEFTDRNLSEGNSVQLVQSLINEVMESNDGVNDGNERNSDNVGGEGEKMDEIEEKIEEKGEDEGVEKESSLREDGFTLFKNLCKLSMKFSSQDHSDDQILLRGKILSLELLKVIMDNGGVVWRSNERWHF